ncbi:MAG: metallophosphoesterase [SAR324 cluster bacterium]|nr:metallophosphoesterase [SAR324 cluster bacterium]
MPSKKTNRTIIIGDLHGCYLELLDLLDLINYQKSYDKIIFTGDLINRGPDSVKSIEFLVDHNCLSVMGNHEYYLIQAVDQKKHDWDIYQHMSKEFGTSFMKLISLLRKLPLWINKNNFLLIHAGFNVGTPLEKTDPEVLTNIRQVPQKQGNLIPWFDLYHEKKPVVFGHWAKLGGVIRQNVIGLDVGCVYGGKLRAVIFPSREIAEVPAHKTYLPIKLKPKYNL